RNVGCASLDHAEHRREHAAHGSNFAPILVACGGQRIIMAEQFVGAVYKINFQTQAPVGKAWNRSTTINLHNRPANDLTLEGAIRLPIAAVPDHWTPNNIRMAAIKCFLAPLLTNYRDFASAEN